MGCPGSASYQIRDDGLVEVNGSVPTFSARAEQEKLLRTWQTYGGALQEASSTTGVPTAWILGVLMQESRGGELNCSSCSACDPRHCSSHLGQTCCAFSIMQFLPSTAEALGYPIEALMQDDGLAILAGAKLLASNLDRYQGDAIKAFVSYNAGSPRCGGATTFGYQTNGDYALDVVRWSNTALHMRLPLVRGGGAIPFLLAAIGVAAAGALYKGLWKPRWI